MKKTLLAVLFFTIIYGLNAGEVKKTFSFSNYQVTSAGAYTKINFDGTKLSGIPGEPMLPYQALSLLLPPGEKAISIHFSGTDERIIPGNFQIAPLQYSQPLSIPTPGEFVKNENVYKLNSTYPADPAGQLMTKYLNGFAFALSTFTPVKYNPVSGKMSYFASVTITIITTPDIESFEALKNLTSSSSALQRVKKLAQNPEMTHLYPQKDSPATSYKMLIITPSVFENSYTDLTDFYFTEGITSQIITTESINASGTGQDLSEKIRNFIIQEYQANEIEYVLLGGDIEHVPFRGFYCYVISGTGYEDYNIPADIYFASLDGNWNTNNDSKWAEPGEDDPLPELSVARFPVSTSGQLSAMIHKTIKYQTEPVVGEWKEPYLVGEHLYDNPITYGSDYLELIVDNHNDNGYTTFGIPSVDNDITRLYDAPGYQWNTQDVLQGINQGKTFIHHVGHSNEIYMMRLMATDITDQNFPMVNGIDHNYTLMYSHGCICGAFDFNDCIAEKSVTINNFLVGGVFNSRYGWFNQGTTDGPSAHLHREFISAMYNDTLPETHLGTAHTISKIMTAPFIALPGEFEPGAQRWCIYDCNVFGDPSLKVWTDEPGGVGTIGNNIGINWSIYPLPAKEYLTIQYVTTQKTDICLSLLNEMGQIVKIYNLNSGSNPSNSFTLNLNEFKPGAYLCKLETVQGSSVKKLIIVR